MGTARSDVYELLKTNLLLEDAVAGEAAGLAMGLVMLGTGSAQAIDDMVQVCLNIIKTDYIIYF
jgi:26S proteasome regulatory subunit N2